MAGLDPAIHRNKKAGSDPGLFSLMSYRRIVIASQRVRANARPDDWLREAIHNLSATPSGLLRRFAPRNDGAEGVCRYSAASFASSAG
jgi:hypothetical protein